MGENPGLLYDGDRKPAMCGADLSDTLDEGDERKKREQSTDHKKKMNDVAMPAPCRTGD